MIYIYIFFLFYFLKKIIIKIPGNILYSGVGMSNSLPRMNNSYYYNKPQPQVPPPPRPYQNYQSLSLNRPNTINSMNPVPNNNAYNAVNKADIDINDLDNMRYILRIYILLNIYLY